MVPVFIHSGFRSGSTYIWSKFRKKVEVTAYYEPFHESLGDDIDRLLQLNSDSWNSHHPALISPYFSEYQRLTVDNRLPNFSREFSYRQFFVDPDESLPALRAYVAMLIAEAATHDTTPVLGFSRSLGRVGWLRTQFDSVNLLVLRNPRSQWASIVKQASAYGNPYFLITYFLICGQNRTHRLVQPLIDRYDIPLILTAHPSRDVAAYEKFLVGVSNEVGYFVFFYHYLSTLIEAGDYAHLIIDMDLLSIDETYRSAIAGQILASTGLALDFGDADVNRYRVCLPNLDYEAIEQEVVALVSEHLEGAAGHRLVRHFAGAGPADRPRFPRRMELAPVTWYDRQAARLQAEIAELRTDLAARDAHIERLLTSTSWTLTRPLRCVADGVRRLTGSPG